MKTLCMSAISVADKIAPGSVLGLVCRLESVQFSRMRR
jgi:hypothetical protein